MKIVESASVNVSDEAAAAAEQMADRLIPELRGKYFQGISESAASFCSASASMRIIPQLERILTFIPDLAGRIILDLGCGASPPTEGGIDYASCEPWLSRALHELGAFPIGVDLGNLAGEPYLTYMVNLEDPRSLSGISDGHIDMAVATCLFNSEKYAARGAEALRKSLIPQLERVLRKDAVFLYGD